MKHTPGPWGVYPDSSPFNVYCDDVTGNRIAACTGEFTTLPESERLANAKLIAAAPELLEALKGIIELGRKDTSNLKYDQYYENALSAIKKATT